MSCAGRVMLAWHLSLSLLRFPKSLTKSTKLVDVLKGPRWEQSRSGFAALSCGDQDLSPWFSLALAVKELSQGGCPGPRVTLK